MATIIHDCKLTPNYQELEKPYESPHKNFERFNVEVTRWFKVAAGDELQFVKELLGYHEIVGLDMHIYKPHAYVGTSAVPIGNCYVLSAETSPFAGPVSEHDDIKKAQYNEMLIIVRYGVPSYNPEISSGQETYLTETIEPASEFMTLARRNLKFDDGTPLAETDEVPSKILRMVEWVYTIHKIPYIPEETFTLPGTANKFDCYSWNLDRWFAWETLLCGNPSLQREVSSEGDTLYSITFRFLYKNVGTFLNPLGWNAFPDPSRVDADGNIYFGPVKTIDTDKDVLVYHPVDWGNLII